MLFAILLCVALGKIADNVWYAWTYKIMQSTSYM